MANALFTSFRSGILGAHATYVDLDSDTIKACFVDATNHTVVVADDFLDDIAAPTDRVPVNQTGPALGTKTITTGVFDAADTTFTALTGDQVEYLLLYKATGTDSTSNLICFWDTATGLPLTPNGGDVTVTWNVAGILSV